jgi:uncharacterized MAPEG superfamily protein
MSQISPAIYSMIAACLLPLFLTMIAKAVGGFRLKDNQNPRAFLAQTHGLAARANAAQANSYETLPVFLAAVLMAEYMVVSQVVINQLAMFYVILRVLYSVAYLINWATLRSIFWWLGFACPMMLLLFAARLS